MNRYILPIIVVALLGFALFKLNTGMAQNAQPDHDDDAAQTQQDTSKKPAAPPPPSSTPGQAGAPATAAAPDEVVVGDPSKAKYKITAGWSYNSANQSNSQQLTSTIDELRKVAKSSNGQVSVQIVDVDVPQDQRSPNTRSIQDVGINVNGKPVSNDNLGEGNSAPQAVSSGIGTMVTH